VSLKKELTKLSSVVGRGQREIDRERDTATERERRTAQSTNKTGLPTRRRQEENSTEPKAKV